MPIRRCSQQTPCSLEDFYKEVSANKGFDLNGVGNDMLRIINSINNLFKKTQIWGLTSHARLILQNVDDSASDGYVTVSGIGYEYYCIEYLMPARKRPWEYAQVKGDVKSLAEAERYMLIAMRESEGWLENEELEQLLVARNL